MASINELSIQGFRSYSPDDVEQVRASVLGGCREAVVRHGRGRALHCWTEPSHPPRLLSGHHLLFPVDGNSG